MCEFNLEFEGRIARMRDDDKRAAAAEYFGEGVSRYKRLPPLKRLLRDPEKEKKITDEEAKKMKRDFGHVSHKLAPGAKPFGAP